MVVSGGGAGVPIGQQGQCLGRQAGHKVGEDKGKLKSKRTDWNPWGQMALFQSSLPTTLMAHVICRRSRCCRPRTVTRTWPKTRRAWRKIYSKSWRRGDPAALSSRWHELTGQWPNIHNAGNCTSNSSWLTHNKPANYISSPTLPWEPTVVDFTQVLSELIPDTLARGWRERTGRVRFRDGVNQLNFRRGWSEDGEKRYHFLGIEE